MKTVLEAAAPSADLFVVGLDSNVAGEDAHAFKALLLANGFDFSDTPDSEQVHLGTH